MAHLIKQSVFFLARLLGLFALARILTRKRVRILCYHGGCIGDEYLYNPKLFCSAALLEARMGWLQRKGFALQPLEQAVAAARGGPRPALSTAITFDDGWHSTASALVPVLARLGIPSTLYLCTRHFLEQGTVPSVAVHYLLWKTALPEARIAGCGDQLDGQWRLGDPAQRAELIERAVAALEASGVDKTLLLGRLGAGLGVDPATFALASRRFDYMNREQLLALAAQGCTVELHGHVHHYPAGDPQAFRRDLQACRDAIVAQGLSAPRHYCYPSGNFDAAASVVLHEQGVVSATTCLPGLIGTVTPSQAHYLPRFLDGESITMLEFQAEMSGFSDCLRALRGGRSAIGAFGQSKAVSQRA